MCKDQTKLVYRTIYRRKRSNNYTKTIYTHQRLLSTGAWRCSIPQYTSISRNRSTQLNERCKIDQRWSTPSDRGFSKRRIRSLEKDIKVDNRARWVLSTRRTPSSARPIHGLLVRRLMMALSGVVLSRWPPFSSQLRMHLKSIMKNSNNISNVTQTGESAQHVSWKQRRSSTRDSKAPTTSTCKST